MKWFQFDNPAYRVRVLDYTYTSQPSINTALPLQTSRFKQILFYLGVLVTFGFLWLLSRWSAKRRALFRTNICPLQQATHFLIRDEDNGGEMSIVQRTDKFQMRLKRKCIAFNYHDRNYIYIEEKEVFVPIRYQQLGHHLDQLKKDRFVPLSETKRIKLVDYFGQNVIRLIVQSRLDIFIQEMLTPYEVFQTYGIILWIFEEYYIFAFILLAYSIYTYWNNASQIRANQEKLAFQSYFDVQTKVLVNDTPQTEDQGQVGQQVELCSNSPKLDEHKSALMKDEFNGLDVEIHEDEDNEQKRETTICRKVSHQVRNQQNNLINNRNIRFQTISSHRLVPGDIIILNQLDRVPCDCILLRGQALVNEKYSTGENYLIRKEEIENFTYQKQNEKSFVLYLGTEIVKIKNFQHQRKNTEQSEFERSRIDEQDGGTMRHRKRKDNELQCIESSMRDHKIDAVNQIVCLVTHTNFSTLRGKYLRAIRYQNKYQEQFFKETIYFIYIIILLSSLIYFAYLAKLGPYTNELDMFRIFMDLLITAIPPTLPTILNLGIEFVIRRLKAQGINSVIPKFILTGGKIDTVVLEGEEVFGKDYQVHSATIGTKGDRGFGLAFTSVNQFQAYHDNEPSHIDFADLERKISQRGEFYRIGSCFVNALACCHTLEFYRKQVHGSVVQRKVFQFAQATNTAEDCFETLNYQLQVRKVIRFNARVMKLAVLARFRQKPSVLKDVRPKSEQAIQDRLKVPINQFTSKGRMCSIELQVQQSEKRRQQEWHSRIFLKGSAEKVLQSCTRESYPADAFDYIVDMAEKGFMLLAYAMLQIPNLQSVKNYHDIISRNMFTFLGFVVLQQTQAEENLQAIKDLNEAEVKLIFVSQQRELQAASKAMFNGVCKKNQLLLCSLTRQHDAVTCKGHIEWRSSTPEIYPEFITQFQEFGRNSKVCLSAGLYEELFMKRDLQATNSLFDKSIIFNKMEIKHEKSLFSQLQRRGRVCCAVGRSGSLYESAGLSLELQREQSALLSSFYTISTSLKSIVTCLRICRAGLSTNFHGFSMMILFSLIQFTTVVILNLNYQTLTSYQSLYEDLFITFPIFVTINLTQPASKLSKELPPNSFFSLRHVISMIGQLMIQFLVQLCFILWVLSLDIFSKQRQVAKNYYMNNGTFVVGSSMSLALFVLSNNIYLGIVLSTSVSKPFRKPFYTNPFYTVNLILLWCYNTFLVIFPSLSPQQMRSKSLSQQSQFILVVALLVGNLTMVVMYLFQNLIVFLWSKQNPCVKRNTQQRQHQNNQYQMDEVIK